MSHIIHMLKHQDSYEQVAFLYRNEVTRALARKYCQMLGDNITEKDLGHGQYAYYINGKEIGRTSPCKLHTNESESVNL